MSEPRLRSVARGCTRGASRSPHPITGARVICVAPLPADLRGGAAGAGVIFAGVRLDDHVPAVLDRARALLRLPGGPSAELARVELRAAASACSSCTKALVGDRALAKPATYAGERLGAYLLWWWPQTYVKTQAALRMSPMPASPRMLDVGSGPGAAALAGGRPARRRGALLRRIGIRPRRSPCPGSRADDARASARHVRPDAPRQRALGAGRSSRSCASSPGVW